MEEEAITRLRLAATGGLSLENQWLQEHGSDSLDSWIVVEGDPLVSHGPDGKAVYDARRC